MVQALKNNWIAAVCLLFIVINTVAIAQEFYWLNLVPVALVVVWAMVASVERLLLFIVFATPLSINLEQLDLGGIGIALPTEPLMVGIMLLFLLKLALERNVVSREVLTHPVTAVMAAQLIWMAVCIVPSSMPMVSFKFLVARLWFICSMYFVASRLFEDKRNMHRFFWLFCISLSLVVVYTVIREVQKFALQGRGSTGTQGNVGQVGVHPQRLIQPELDQFAGTPCHRGSRGSHFRLDAQITSTTIVTVCSRMYCGEQALVELQDMS